MASRPRHPDKHIEAVLAAAERWGWVVVKASGGCAHAWGRLKCSKATREGCIISVYSTPRNPQNHARHIQRKVGMCPH